MPVSNALRIGELEARIAALTDNLVSVTNAALALEREANWLAAKLHQSYLCDDCRKPSDDCVECWRKRARKETLPEMDGKRDLQIHLRHTDHQKDG